MTLTIQAATAPWACCANCGRPVYAKRRRRHLLVCPECGHHGRWSVRERLAEVLDAGSFEEVAVTTPAAGAVDVLGFADVRPYRERHAAAVLTTGEPEAVLVGTGRVEGLPLVVVALHFEFLGGTMGAAVGDGVVTAAGTACDRRLPLLVVAASGGARLQEGAVALMQMARTTMALEELSRRGLPRWCLITDPTFGGVTASFVAQCDVLLAEPGARLGFAGRRVIEQTVRETLAPDFQTAERCRDRGLIDAVVPRGQVRAAVRRLLTIYASGPSPAPSVPPVASGSRAEGEPPGAARVVQSARDPRRPGASDYIRETFDDFFELRGDRCGRDDPAILAGMASFGGRTVAVLAHHKGHDTATAVERNFGMPHPEGYRKAIRVMDHAERVGAPVVTFVDTPGAYPGARAEDCGQAHAIAECLTRMATLRVPSVAVVTGEGGSGGALALALANRVYVLRDAFYSVISPEGGSAILFGDRAHAAQMAAALRLTASDLLAMGIVDGVLPAGLSDRPDERALVVDGVRAALWTALEEIGGWSAERVRKERSERFARYGVSRAGQEGVS